MLEDKNACHLLRLLSLPVTQASLHQQPPEIMRAIKDSTFILLLSSFLHNMLQHHLTAWLLALKNELLKYGLLIVIKIVLTFTKKIKVTRIDKRL